MDQHLIFLVLGLGNGAVYAALALTLVVTYRSSGVVNFATGSMALLGAYLYAFFREGELLLLLPFLPRSIDLGYTLEFWPAALLSVALCSVVGLLLYLGVFRPLRTAPAVAKAVASIGVMVVLTGLYTQRVGPTGVRVEEILPSSSWTMGDVHITQDRVWMAVVVLVMTLALTVAYRYTRFGLLTRAAAQTEKGALVSGVSPERIAAANWMISAAVAAISGILIAPIVPATPIGYTLFIVPALAAATVGRFQFMFPAVLAGLAIGMLQSDLTYIKGRLDWLPASGLAELVPLIVIFVMLVVQGQPLPGRGAVILQSLGRAPRPTQLAKPLLIGGTLGLVAMVTLQQSWRAALITTMILAIVSLSLVVVTGFAGQISLAQLTLAGVAGFLLAPLSTTWELPLIGTLPFPIAPIVAALGATVVGVVVGLPALRIRGLPVAVVTLAFAVAIEALWFRNSEIAGVGGLAVDGPTLFGLDLRARVGADFPRLGFGILVLVVLLAVAWGVARLRTSTLGSEMLAVRANERSAAGAGVAVVRVKLTAFAIAAFIAGLGGTLLAYLQSNVTYDSFATFVGIGLFATAYIGGITSVSGGVVAGFLAAGGLVAVLSNSIPWLGSWYPVISGVALVLTVVFNPEGIVGPIHAALAAARSARADDALADGGVPGGDLADSAALSSDGSRPAPSDSRADAARADDAGAGDIGIDEEAVTLEPAVPRKGGEVLLSTTALQVRYGGVVAIHGVDIDVREGTIVGLIGPNGAGKTTLLDALSGFAACSGTIRFHGSDISAMPPHKRVRAGLGRTFQQPQLYEDLSVEENVVVGRAGAGEREPLEMDDVLDLLGLRDVAHRPVGELSQGRRQLVSIARALIGNPTLLLLDEPAGGLDSTESLWLGQRLRAIRDRGVTILLIDHDMHLVLNLCDTIHVLDFGSVIAQGEPDEVKNDRRVTEAYLGAAHTAEVE